MCLTLLIPSTSPLSSCLFFFSFTIKEPGGPSLVFDPRCRLLTKGQRMSSYLLCVGCRAGTRTHRTGITSRAVWEMSLGDTIQASRNTLIVKWDEACNINQSIIRHHPRLTLARAEERRMNAGAHSSLTVVKWVSNWGKMRGVKCVGISGVQHGYSRKHRGVMLH